MAKKTELDIAGNTTSLIHTPHITKEAKEASKALLDKFIQEETKLVKGRFKNHENPGGMVKVIVRKYPGISHFEKEMWDGKEYEVPLYVARHLQGFDATAKAVDGKINTCAFAVHSWKTEKDKFPERNLDEGMTVPLFYKRRYGFESLEFEKVM
jgi:hypothetical protein